ncbi:hypothetical protein EV368DRAFT_90170 [Lentinula lateritia]|nr:hypothetical protein EV368DRAFT_90170 [Lentinula lateritia]
MSTVPVVALPDPRSNASPTSTPPPSPNPPISTEEVDVEELASTVEDPPLGQLTLFKSVFGVGVSLARYIVDNPLWPILAAAGLPCSFCVHTRFRYFARKCSRNLSFARRFLEAHGDPGQRTRFSLLPEQWRAIADKIESSTSSARALLELSPLNDQDRFEGDRLELQDLIRCQPKLPTVSEPAPSGTRPPLVPDKVLSVPKKRKRAVRMGEASSSKRKRFVEQDLGVGDVEYRRVVLVLPPQAMSRPEVLEPHTPSRGGAPNKASHPLPSPGVLLPPPPRADTSYGGRMTQPGSFGQFVPPTLTAAVPGDRIKSPPFLQRNREALRPYPRSQVNPSLKTENENLKSEVVELRRLLEVSRAENVTLTSLLRETSSSLDARSKELESSHQALQEFKVIEADFANARAMRLRDRSEELQESVHHYRSRAHVAEGLIHQYPEDEGLYEVDLPSLSSMQDKLSKSEALVRRLATFAHRLYTADPANLLHYHNMYVVPLGSKHTH